MSSSSEYVVSESDGSSSDAEFVPGKKKAAARATPAKGKASRKIVAQQPGPAAAADADGGQPGFQDAGAKGTAAKTSAAQPTPKGPRTLKAMPSKMPLVLPTTKRNRTFLMSIEPEIDFTGDVATIGRVSLKPKDQAPVHLDLKGSVYKGQLVKSHTFLVVDISAGTAKAPAQAKITNVVRAVVESKCVANHMDTEAVIEGELGEEDETAYMHSEQIMAKKSAQKKPSAPAKRKRGAAKGKGKKRARKSTS